MRLKRLALAFTVTLTLLVGIVIVALVATQTAWFRNWLRGYITREAHQYLNGELSIGRLNGNLFFGIELEDVAVALNNQPVVSVRDLSVRYNALDFLRSKVSIEAIRLDRPVVHLSRDGETWTISTLLKKDTQEANRKGPGRSLSIEDINVSAGSIFFEQPFVMPGLVVPASIDGLDLQLAFMYEPVHYSVEIGHVSFHGQQPSFDLNDLTGGVAVLGDRVALKTLAITTAESHLTIDGGVQDYLTNPAFALQMTSPGISLPEIGRVVPSVAGVDLKPALALKLSGPLNQLATEVSVRSSAGNLHGTLAADLAEPDLSVNGELKVDHLNVAPITGGGQPITDLTAVIKPRLRAASFTDLDSVRGDVVVATPAVSGAGYHIDRFAARAVLTGRHAVLEGSARAYQAAATFRGTVGLPVAAQPVTFDLRGAVHGVNLSSLPPQLRAPSVDTDVNADYRLVGSGTTHVSTEIRFAESRLPGARIEEASTVNATVDLGRGQKPQVDYRADLVVSDVDLRRLGRAFAVQALDHTRYETLLNLRASAAGHGLSVASMETSVSGVVNDSRLLGGHVPELTFDATLAADTAHVRAAGGVTDLDPAVASQQERLAGQVAGSLEADVTVAQISRGFDLDRVDGTARLSLSRSQVGQLRIDRGVLEASLAQSTVSIGTLELNGPDTAVKANGSVALTPEGDSWLTLHAGSSDLRTVGVLVGQPLTGFASVDATVTGNRPHLHAAGTFSAGDVTAGDYSALTISTEYTADLPNLSVADASVSANTTGTFLTLAGQNINKITAKTDYEHGQLDVDVTATQPNRTLAAAGAVRLNPDAREVRLTRLDLSNPQLRWQMTPDANATIRYGGGVTTVEGLRLESGDQEIAVEGSFGQITGRPLMITASHVDLAQVDAILLRPPQFSGVLDASAVVSGTTDRPEARAEFAVNGGGFRAFRYQDFKGTVSYNGQGVTVDARLQQSPAAQVRVSGYVPATAWHAPVQEAASGGSAASDQFDLRVESDSVDLGIVQGFTTELTNVTGSVQANIQVTGVGNDPRPNGQITLTNGAFTVVSTGVPYSAVNGRVELQEDRVHIARLEVVDNSKSPMSLTGDIPIRRTLTGDVNLQVTARDFKILDNKMGNLRLDTHLAVAGELRAPRIEGEIAVTTGSVNLDPILATAGGGAYATKPAEIGDSDVEPDPDNPGQSSSPMRNVAVDVHLKVPNDLVVKSSDLKTSAAPIGLGRVNVTLGGDLRATKAPNGGVRLDGTVTAVRGTYDFQGRQFTILRDGQVRFEGNPIDQLNPSLDVKTQRVIQGVVANANIRGTLRRPRIDLTSVPPLERADILSLIVFNQPVNQLGEGQQISLGQRAEQLALGSIAGELSKSLGSLLNVSEFQIQAAPDSGAAAQVTVGQQVNERLFVKVEQGVGDVSTTNAVLEYELTQWLHLQTNLIQAAAAQQALFQAVRDSGLDLIFVFTR